MSRNDRFAFALLGSLAGVFLLGWVVAVLVTAAVRTPGQTLDMEDGWAIDSSLFGTWLVAGTVVVVAAAVLRRRRHRR